MFDASKYAQHFPDEYHQAGALGDKPASINPAAPTRLLLAALSRLEKEFRDILRAQTGAADPLE